MAEKTWKKIEQENVFPFDNKGAKIEGNLVKKQAGSFGDNYTIQTANGEEFLVFGTTVLNNKMASVEEGKEVRITFLGEEKAEKSGRMYKDFDVEVAE